ncbi:MAG TPA: extracellular solute-binding protein, partial [Bdellovibrionales bacterium]|nr:extracellular solute-binding protein [Bdellovibrionales bacterium]
GEQAGAYLAKLKPNLHSVSPSWSTAYGLFKKKEAKIVLSYLTSPLYHKVAENDDGFEAAVFTQGHVAHVEYAAIPAACTSCKRAEEFLEFLLQAESQTRLMELNYMLPVSLAPAAGSPFAELAKPKILPHPAASREELLAVWKAVFSP